MTRVLERLLARGWPRVYSTRDFFVIRVTLAGPPTPDHVGEVVFRWASQQDLERLETLDVHGRGSTQKVYVAERGDLLFVACHGDRIVATRRCSHEIRDPLAARVVELRPGQLWGADVFCVPAYRSQGVGSRLALFADRQLASKGYTELLATVEARNLPSLRLSLGKGSELAYHVSYMRLPFYERLRVSERMPRWVTARRGGSSS